MWFAGQIRHGRFKCPVIAADEHLLSVMRHVESNPLRAGMVSDLAAEPWSRYVVHGLGKSTRMVDEAPAGAGLAKAAPVRQASWRDWLHKALSASDRPAIRRCVTSGRPYGGGAWVAAMAKRRVIDLTTRAPGRPRKAET